MFVGQRWTYGFKKRTINHHEKRERIDGDAPAQQRVRERQRPPAIFANTFLLFLFQVVRD